MPDKKRDLDQEVWDLYAKLTEEFGVPEKPLKQVISGHLAPTDWAVTTQILGKSTIALSVDLHEYREEMEDESVQDIMLHELAHVWVGVEVQHETGWKDMYNIFKNFIKSS